MNRCKLSIYRGGVPIFKQGEQVLVQFQVRDGKRPFGRLKTCRVEIALSTPRRKALRLGHNTTESVLPVVVDTEGYIAFVIDGARSKGMSGVYSAEVAVIENNSRLVSESFEVFEVVNGLSKIK